MLSQVMLAMLLQSSPTGIQSQFLADLDTLQDEVTAVAKRKKKRRKKRRRRQRRRAKKKTTTVVPKQATTTTTVKPAAAPPAPKTVPAVPQPTEAKPQPPEDLRPGIAALDLMAVSGVEKTAARLMNEAILTRLKASKRFRSVLGSSDLQAMLSLEQQKAVLGCDEVGCLAELGGALGVPLLFSADVGKVGGRFMLNMKILRVDEADVAARLTLIYPNQDELIQELNEAVDALAAKAFGEAIPQSVIARSSAPIALTAEQKAARLRKALLVGSTVTVGAASAIASVLYLNAEQDHFDGLTTYQTDAFERLNQAESRANWGMGIGVGIVLIGGVLAW